VQMRSVSPLSPTLFTCSPYVVAFYEKRELSLLHEEDRRLIRTKNWHCGKRGKGNFGQYIKWHSRSVLPDVQSFSKCDQATYNAFFQGLAKVGKVDEIWTMFGTMKEQGIVPTYLLFNTIICALLSHNRLNNAYTTFLELKASFCLIFLLICEVHTCVCSFSCGDKP